MSPHAESIPFRANAVRNATLRNALSNATGVFTAMRAEAVSSIPVEDLRDHASRVRVRVLDSLPEYVELFSRNAARAGAHVHRAHDSVTATHIVAYILRDHRVNRVVGGHAYGSTYPGPMGTVLTTLLEGMARAHPFLDATTLCGACEDVCPVKVPLPKHLRRLRELRVAQEYTPQMEQKDMTGPGLALRSPLLFHSGQNAARTFWRLAQRTVGKKVLGRMPEPTERTFGKRFS